MNSFSEFSEKSPSERILELKNENPSLFVQKQIRWERMVFRAASMCPSISQVSSSLTWLIQDLSNYRRCWLPIGLLAESSDPYEEAARCLHFKDQARFEALLQSNPSICHAATQVQ